MINPAALQVGHEYQRVKANVQGASRISTQTIHQTPRARSPFLQNTTTDPAVSERADIAAMAGYGPRKTRAQPSKPAKKIAASPSQAAHRGYPGGAEWYPVCDGSPFSPVRDYFLRVNLNTAGFALPELVQASS